MKKLEIAITKAQLVSFHISANEGKPAVSVTLALLTEGGKKITTYTAETDAWKDEDKLDIPISALPLIGDLARILEKAAVSHCRDSQLALASPKVTVASDFDKVVAVADISDEPINLDEIPF